MRAHVVSSWILLLLATVAPVAPAQTPAVASGEAKAPLRIDIVGASVSAGFADGPMTGGSAPGIPPTSVDSDVRRLSGV